MEFWCVPLDYTTVPHNVESLKISREKSIRDGSSGIADRRRTRVRVPVPHTAYLRTPGESFSAVVIKATATNCDSESDGLN